MLSCQATYNSIRVSWESPAFIEAGLEDLVQYRVTVSGGQEEREVITEVGDERSVSVTRLRSDSPYSVAVAAFVPQFEIEDDLQGQEFILDIKYNPVILTVLIESLPGLDFGAVLPHRMEEGH